PVLRTAFVAADAKRPLQVVQRGAALDFVEEDWSRVPAGEQAPRFETWLAEDQARGFELAQAPLLRLALQRLGGGSWRLGWPFHHLPLDGWSPALLFEEILARYAAARSGRAASIARPRPFRDFIAWLRRRDAAADEAFWRARLAGFAAPTPLVVERLAARAAAPALHAGEPEPEPEIELDARASAALDAFARRHALTASTLVHAPWGLLPARYGAETEVVFGSTVSGRPADLPGVDAMVGMFINTITVRVRVAARPLVAWLRELQAELFEARQHEWAPLVELQRWSQVP